jgi:alpha-methylacyl-CoA racemase
MANTSNTNRSVSKPLRGIKVVSLALNLPGPACVMQLRAMGASCTKIEPPSGDPMALYMPHAYQQMHAGIKHQTLDLKSDSGQLALAKQLANTDVLITSFRPSAMRKLGLGWRALHKRYPALIHIDVVGAPGELAEIPGHDLTYMAEQGLVTKLSVPPSLFADMGGALMATNATLSALLSRANSGNGQRMEVALSNAAQWLGLPNAWGLTTPSGAVGGAHAGYNVYACADGRVAVAALEPHFAKALAGVAKIKVSAASDWFGLPLKAQLSRFFKRHSRAQLDAWALEFDLPLHTMV